jgi:uncharacterized protein YeaO (DUF488 family)
VILSWKLLNDYKEGRIDWVQYTKRFRREMDCDPFREEMKRIWDFSQKNDVYLVCYEPPGQNCHRHPLMDMMRMWDGEKPDK